LLNYLAIIFPPFIIISHSFIRFGLLHFPAVSFLSHPTLPLSENERVLKGVALKMEFLSSKDFRSHSRPALSPPQRRVKLKASILLHGLIIVECMQVLREILSASGERK
jgi:hypothetical protein